MRLEALNTGIPNLWMLPWGALAQHSVAFPQVKTLSLQTWEPGTSAFSTAACFGCIFCHDLTSEPQFTCLQYGG